MKLNEVADMVPQEERKVLDVIVPANIYDGKYYDYRYARVPAYAASEQEAVELVKSQPEAVLQYLDQKRAAGGKRRYIASPIERNVFFDKVSRAKDSGRISVGGKGLLALTPNGFQRIEGT